MPRKPESDMYVPTPMLVLGPERYAELKAQAEKILKAQGWDGRGVPALIFDGPGGIFFPVQGMEQS